MDIENSSGRNLLTLKKINLTKIIHTVQKCASGYGHRPRSCRFHGFAAVALVCYVAYAIVADRRLATRLDEERMCSYCLADERFFFVNTYKYSHSLSIKCLPWCGNWTHDTWLIGQVRISLDQWCCQLSIWIKSIECRSLAQITQSTYHNKIRTFCHAISDFAPIKPWTKMDQSWKSTHHKFVFSSNERERQ